MTLPDSIKVGPYTYPITADEDAVNAASVRRGDRVSAQIDYWTNSILIRPSMHVDRQAAGLLHEALHGMNDLIGQREYDKDLTEEQHVKMLAPVLLQFIRDNPAVIAFLAEGS